MRPNEATTREAINWLIQQRDPSFAAWDEFTRWLEADAENARAYQELSLLDAGVAERLSNVPFVAPLSASPRPPSGSTGRRGKRPWTRRASRRGAVLGGGALAASLAGLLLLNTWTVGRALYSVRTPAGVQRTLSLENGTTIALNGATTVTLDRDDPRFASLEDGEAFFEVRHDANRPFRVEVGDATLIDLGTSFNVLRERDSTRVAVAEGVVQYKVEGESVRLNAGQQVLDTSELWQVSRADGETVGTWRGRRLVYRGAPMATLASDLSRMIGVRVIADASVATRPITAVVQVPKSHEELARRLESLLNIAVNRSQDHWTLTQR